MSASSTSSALALDHLVVAAATLDDGAEWCRRTLGAAPGPRGEHAFMGTHNRLLGVAGGDFPLAYLEVIAIDPAAPSPGRARWFGLDDAALQARLLADGPRLVHWVARSSRLDLHRRRLVDAGQRPGEPLGASRGAYAWDILVADDGRPGCDGALPTLLQWHSDHPGEALPASGVLLQRFGVGGVPPGAQDVLRMRGVQWRQQPGLQAVLATPHGTITLES